nr:MAG TPA: hypothetical protein [Caudoviricetes sp.]
MFHPRKPVKVYRGLFLYKFCVTYPTSLKIVLFYRHISNKE